MESAGTDFADLDYSALIGEVDREAVKRYRAERADRRKRVQDSVSLVSRAVRVAVAVPVLVAVVIGVGLVTSLVGGGLSRALGLTEGAARVLPFVVLAVVAVIALVVGLRMHARATVEDFRFHEFARANGMSFVAEEADPARPGLLFSRGRARRATRLLRAERRRATEFANYRYTTGSGKRSTTHRWGYAAIRLGTPLPHIVLDAVGNNGLFGASNLPASFDRGQRLRLEGDFDRYFALYCPEGYERDALYLFTPDIMARFVDHAALFDVEIVDDWLFLYARGKELVAADPGALAATFSVVDAVAAKLAQWERWRDERLLDRPSVALDPAALHAVAPDPSGQLGAEGVAVDSPISAPARAVAAPVALVPERRRGVAAEGRRLRRRVSVPGLIGFIVIIGYWVWVLVR